MFIKQGVCLCLLALLLIGGCQTAATQRKPPATASNKDKAWNDRPLASQNNSKIPPAPEFPGTQTSTTKPAPFGTASPSSTPFPGGSTALPTSAPTSPFLPSGATVPTAGSNQSLVIPQPAPAPAPARNLLNPPMGQAPNAIPPGLPSPVVPPTGLPTPLETLTPVPNQ